MIYDDLTVPCDTASSAAGGFGKRYCRLDKHLLTPGSARQGEVGPVGIRPDLERRGVRYSRAGGGREFGHGVGAGDHPGIQLAYAPRLWAGAPAEARGGPA